MFYGECSCGLTGGCEFCNPTSRSQDQLYIELIRQGLDESERGLVVRLEDVKRELGDDEY